MSRYVYRSLRERAAGLVLMLGIAVSSALVLWPKTVESFARLSQAGRISGYQEEIGRVSSGGLDEMRQAAVRYNETVRIKQQKEGFRYAGADATDAEYEKALRTEDGIMGCLEAPAADIFLPVGHGTSEEVLSVMAGHLYGTSLPVGGPGSHAVIAGHTGMPSADLFSGLARMEKGDPFTLHVAGKNLCYRVSRILTVLPEEADRYLGISGDRDLVTLYTCTPYGINDHRLLVTGERDPGAERAADTADDGEAVLAERRRSVRAGLVCTAAVPVLFAGAGAAEFMRGRRREGDSRAGMGGGS